MDSYIEFLKHFNITADEFFKWGMEATIFPQENKVAAEWDALKKRLFSDEQVYIRGYGRDTHGTWLYKELYRSVFNNKPFVTSLQLLPLATVYYYMWFMDSGLRVETSILRYVLFLLFLVFKIFSIRIVSRFP